MVQTVEDTVVVPNHQKNILSQHTKVLALLVDLGCIVGHFKSQSLPVLHLIKEPDEILAEVGKDKPIFRPGRMGG